MIGTSCCDVPAISEKAGDTRSSWCGLSSHDCLGSRVIATSCCDIPAISENVGDTRSPWCGQSSDGVFKKGTV